MSTQPSPPEEQTTAAAPAEAKVAAADFPAEVQPDQLPRALFGYDRSTIVELLNTMSARIRALGLERTAHEQRIGELEAEIKRNEEHQVLIGETLVSAREEAKAIKEEARAEALKLLRAAEKQARRIVEDAERTAQAKADELVESAEEMRRTVLTRTQQERQAVLDEAKRAKAFVEETHEQLSDFLMAAVRWYEQAKPSTEQDTASEPLPSLAGAPAPVPAAQPPSESPAGPENDRSSIPSS